jgi:hypothetical protein
MRGLAVLLMIPTHVFNCFTRDDLRPGSAYVFSQFIGGMAAPLFLFLAGITSAFQMDTQDRKQPSPWGRVRAALRRAGYILALAFCVPAQQLDLLTPQRAMDGRAARRHPELHGRGDGRILCDRDLPRTGPRALPPSPVSQSQPPRRWSPLPAGAGRRRR